MAVGWRTCPQCGKNNEPGKRYCVECGASLTENVAAYQEAIRLLQTVTDHPGSPDDPDQEERIGRLIGMGPGVVPTIAGAIWSAARYGTGAYQVQNAGLLCEALGRIGGDKAFDALTRFASLDPGAVADRTIRLGAIRGLGLLGDPRAEQTLASARQDPDEEVRDAATCALDQLQQQGAGSPHDEVAAPAVPQATAEVVPAPTAKPPADTEPFYHEEWNSAIAHPAGWEVISQDEPAGSWTMPPETGANRSRSMEATPLTCSIEPFSIENTALKTQLDSGPLVALFHQELAGQLARHGLAVQESHPSLAQPHFSIEGAFVRIDEGNRVARYFLSWMAGQAVVEVEGWLYQNNRPVRELYAKGSQGAGIFGGAAEGLLKKSASFAAKQIANQVAQALINQ